MPDYYYLVAGFPDLLLDTNKQFPGFNKFLLEICEQVSTRDREWLQVLLLPDDNRNLIEILENRVNTSGRLGLFSREELYSQIKKPDSLPSYMVSLIEAFHESKPIFPPLSWEDQLSWLFYDWAAEHASAFIREWFVFELNLRNLLVGLNCRKFKKPLEQFILCRNEISELILKSSAPDFSLYPVFPVVESVLTMDLLDMVEREKALDMLRWQVVDEMTLFSYFEIETILAFCLKLAMVERWDMLKPETGKTFFEQLVLDMKKSVPIYA